uniref:DUF1376 domain-containing protein n=1 Tax=Strongyloides venezuelensis TaxID=75913 RepID=A0A0K0FT55_STRVS
MLIETQSDELTRMLQFYNNGNIKPFTRGGDVEFGKLMVSVLGYIKFRTVDSEGFKIADQLYSDAYSYLQKVMEIKVDRNEKLKNNLCISDLFEDIWTEMKDSQVHKKVQFLAKNPVWKHGKDNLEGLNKRCDKYLSQRLGVQNVAAYLNSVPLLKRKYYINYIECIPAYIKKEVKAFLKMFTKVKANLKTLEIDFKSHNAHNSDNKSKRYPNYNNKSSKNYSKNIYKKHYKEKKTTPNENNTTGSDNKSQNGRKLFPQNGNNSKNFKNNYNDNRKEQ